jgi:hypothetical protein
VEIEELSKGDRVLFNDRKRPLEVAEVEDGEAVVEGPGGGRYVLYTDEETALVSKEGNRRYSSYLKDLREVGEWNHESENLWKHSNTGAEIRLVENNGIWRLESDIDHNIETPGMGYMQRESAVEDVQKIVKKNPEGGR